MYMLICLKLNIDENTRLSIYSLFTLLVSTWLSLSVSFNTLYYEEVILFMQFIINITLNDTMDNFISTNSHSNNLYKSKMYPVKRSIL